MNKIKAILMIVLFSIIYLVNDMFLPDNTQNTSVEKINIRFETIRPPILITNTVDFKIKTNDSLIVENKKNNQQDSSEFSMLERISTRQELIDLYENKKLNYITLGEIIEKIKSEQNTSKSVMEHLDRIKHNLELAKKIAELTKNLHVQINGKKEFNNEVFKKLIEIQKQTIVPFININYRAEN